MKPEIGITQPTTFPDDLGVTNSGVGLTQLPPNHTKIAGSAIASIGVTMNAGVPGQFQQNTKMSIADGFGKVIKVER